MRTNPVPLSDRELVISRLELVPNERLDFTDAYSTAWEQSEKPFMTVILTFADEAGKTKYTARVRRWTVAGRETHEQVSFHCTNQLRGARS
jgi:uncharacterized protein YndB with AHSA1/START domain